MENIILYLCSCLSCFIIITILFGFMNDRYNRTFTNKYIYIGTELGITFGIAVVNLVHNEILNITTWIVVVGLVACILYFEDFIKPVKRILECEILAGILSICESLGVGLTDWILELWIIYRRHIPKFLKGQKCSFFLYFVQKICTSCISS